MRELHEKAMSGGSAVDLPAAVCEDIAVPALKSMSTAHFLKSLLARFEAEVVSVVET